MTKKNVLGYVYTSLIILGVLVVVYAFKGVFPFGNNSIIWGDLHNQITAFLYHLYDAFKDSSSLLIDFYTSGGINFWGIMAYYIISPFNFLLLLFQRVDIYKVVSIIVALKFVMCGITSLFFIKTYFKKLPNYISVFLAVMYAFSGYNLIMYQITPWIDIVYLFPLLLIGLKKLLDLDTPIYYILFLFLSLACSFYLTILLLIFIFINSLIYLYCFKKERKKEAVVSLGLSTLLVVLIGAFILFPTFKELLLSSRVGIDFNSIYNSGVGPLGDKVSFFYPTGLLLIVLIMNVIKLYGNNRYRPFLKYLILTLVLLILPVIIEPINLMLHMGSYVCFPYRYGFIPIFFIIIGVAYTFNIIRDPALDVRHPILNTLIGIVLIAILGITMFYYKTLQVAIETLCISKFPLTCIILSIICVVVIFLVFLLYFKYKNNHKRLFISIWVIGIVVILANSITYLGMDFKMDELMQNYELMNAIGKTSEKTPFRLKNLYTPLVRNFGLVTKYNALDHFTSLTAKTNMDVLKRLGYSSLWMDTSSEGGTVFTDMLLGNKYLLTNDVYNSKYYQLKEKVDNLYLYETNLPISYGYLINQNVSVVRSENGFMAMNQIYNMVTGTNDQLFETYNDFSYNNLKLKFKNNKTLYQIISDRMVAIIKQDIDIKEESIVYLDILKSLDNASNQDIRYKMKIYVNDKVFLEEYTTKGQNGIVNLGMYNNETVKVKIELLGDIELTTLEVGVLNTKKFENFINNNKLDTLVTFKRNQVSIKLDSPKSNILFLPLAYDKGYVATNNGNKTEVIKVFDNFIGINVNGGNNEIKLTYRPTGLSMGVKVSIVSVILAIVLLATGLYNKILSCGINGIIYYMYIISYIGVIFVIYVIPFIYFVYDLLGGKI